MKIKQMIQFFKSTKKISVVEILTCFCIAALFLYGCSDNKKAPFLTTAIQFKYALEESDVWAEVIHYTYEDLKTSKRHKHAVVMFKYPMNAPDVRIYDKDGSKRFFDLYYINKDNIGRYSVDIAIKVEQSKRNYHHSIIEAEVIK